MIRARLHSKQSRNCNVFVMIMKVAYYWHQMYTKETGRTEKPEKVKQKTK